MPATDAPMVILRIVHIVTGVIWVGSLFVVVVFVQPSAATLGEAGAPFISELRRRRFVDVVFIDAVFTVVAGSFLYWRDWHSYPNFGDWVGSSFGTALTVGALQHRLVVAERVSFSLVLLAVVAMASARYV